MIDWPEQLTTPEDLPALPKSRLVSFDDNEFVYQHKTGFTVAFDFNSRQIAVSDESKEGAVSAAIERYYNPPEPLYRKQRAALAGLPGTRFADLTAAQLKQLVGLLLVNTGGLVEDDEGHLVVAELRRWVGPKYRE